MPTAEWEEQKNHISEFGALVAQGVMAMFRKVGEHAQALLAKAGRTRRQNTRGTVQAEALPHGPRHHNDYLKDPHLHINSGYILINSDDVVLGSRMPFGVHSEGALGTGVPRSSYASLNNCQ